VHGGEPGGKLRPFLKVAQGVGARVPIRLVHGKPPLGQLDRRRDQLRPALAPVPAVDLVQPGEQPRDSHRLAAVNAGRRSGFGWLGLGEVFGSGASGGRFPEVEGHQGFLLGPVGQHEAPAAESGALWPRDAQSERGGDRRVEGVSPAAQYRGADLGRFRGVGRDHSLSAASQPEGIGGGRCRRQAQQQDGCGSSVLHFAFLTCGASSLRIAGLSVF